MMRVIAAALFGLLMSSTLCAQTARVLIVGDSWAEEMWLDGSHEVIFAVNGASEISAIGGDTTISGSTAAEWATPDFLQLITDALAANPQIDIVQLTVGGNDFLDAWSINLPPMQVDLIKAQILEHLQVIVAHILEQDPRLDVLLSFYDYPNFRDTRSGLIWLFACSGLWNDLGQPDATQLNTAAIDFVDTYAELAIAHPRVFQVRHFGVTQREFGIDGIPAGSLVLPGDPTKPSPLQAMRIRGALGVDCFHLAAPGYDALVQNLFDGYYQTRFDTLLRSAFE